MNTQAAAVWQQARAYLAESLSKDVYERWIAVIEVRALSETRIELTVANDFYQSWLEENYLPLIRQALMATCGRELQIALAVDARPKTANPAAETLAGETAAPAAPARSASPAKAELALNPKYTFESFVVGPSNNLAHAAALAVAEAPARAYNPLFIYGGVGLGKTHLMHAVGHCAFGRNQARVTYVSSETFTNDYVDAIKHGTPAEFRKKYRSSDILLIDDIQFLAGKDRMQEEFFHTFNALYERHKQIVLTSDRPASEIPNLEKRLVSRFEWGMVVELEHPDVETRVAILRKKQDQLNLRLPDEIIQFLAERIRSNIRSLEGALMRVACFSSLPGHKVTQETLEYLLRDTLDLERQEALTLETVQRVVAEYYDIRLGDMTSKQRPQAIAFPRQVAMYLCRSMTEHSLPDIGNAFGRNHATVMHACKLVDEKLKGDASFRQTVTLLRQRLGQRQTMAETLAEN